MIVTGAKEVEKSKIAVQKYIAIIKKVGYPQVIYRDNDYKIQNMTATTDVGFAIRLEGLIYAHASNATYEPELFPGLIYRMTDPKVVLLIFVTGKIVITGAKTEDTFNQALCNIYEVLHDFRKTSTSQLLPAAK